MRSSYRVLAALIVISLLLTSELEGRRKRGRKGRRKGGRRRNKDKTSTQKDCGPIPHVEKGQGLATGDNVHYACQPGFRLQGTNVITCINGRWTVAPRCVRELCPTPDSVAFAHSPTMSNDGITATYRCHSGYGVHGSMTVTSATVHCSTSSKTWPNMPVCKPIPVESCGAPPEVKNAMSQVSGKTATYTCHHGFWLHKGTPSTIHCISHQWMYPPLPKCVADPSTPKSGKKCLKPPPCGDETIVRDATADSYDVGSKITYRCITGYRITGSGNNKETTAEVECKHDGTYSDVPTCEKVVCGIPLPGTNTVPIIPTGVKFGDIFTYACITNFVTGSALVARCLEDGKWSIPPPVCTGIVCPYSNLPTLTNGSPTGIATGADTLVGQNVTFTCNNLYRVAPASVGSTAQTQQVTCLANGTFSALAQTCVYIYPLSCVDYFTRDGLSTSAVTTTPIFVLIDADGSGTASSPVNVSCTIPMAGTVCTDVAPTSGQLLGAEETDCGGTGFGGVFPGVTAGGAGAGVARTCMINMVQYTLSPAQITDLISRSTNCQQVVMIQCTNAMGLFLFMRGNAQTVGLAYNADDAGITDPAAGVFQTGVCDCHEMNACMSRGCICSDDAGVGGTDTITIPLTSGSPNFVVEYGRGGNGGAAGDEVDIADDEFDVSIGNIQCCTTV